MSVVIESADFVVPLADRLLMRKLQTDPHGEVLGGHGAIFDFASMTGALGVDDRVPNVVYKGAAADVLGAFPSLATNKGLLFTTTAGSGERLRLPRAAFDLTQMGDEPSAIFYAWMTQLAAPTSGFQSIWGAASAAGAGIQWSMYSTTSALRINTRLGAGLEVELPLLTNNAPTLVSLVLDRRGTNSARMRAFVNKNQAGSTLVGSYDFGSYVWSETNCPAIGLVNGGYNASWSGRVHRVGSLQFDPQHLDPAEFIAAEYERNTGRFTL